MAGWERVCELPAITRHAGFWKFAINQGRLVADVCEANAPEGSIENKREAVRGRSRPPPLMS